MNSMMRNGDEYFHWMFCDFADKFDPTLGWAARQWCIKVVKPYATLASSRGNPAASTEYKSGVSLDDSIINSPNGP